MSSLDFQRICQEELRYHHICVNFLYLSCSAIMDSPGGEFNSYKSKRLAEVKYFKLGRI